MSSKPNYKILTGSIIDSIRQGADGVSCHVNIGPDQDAEMLLDLSEISLECDEFEIPLMAMMYVRDNSGNDTITIESLSLTCRPNCHHIPLKPLIFKNSHQIHQNRENLI